MKNLKKAKSAILALAVMGITSVSSFCQDDLSASKADKLIEKLDTNDDKQIDKAESKANTDLSANFEKIDKNKDGLISKQELMDHLAKSKKG